MLKALAGGLLVACLTVPAFAATYSLTVRNQALYPHPVRKMTVKGGEISGVPPVKNQPSDFPIKVRLDEGPCFRRVSIFLYEGGRLDVMGDLCKVEEIVIE